MVQRIYQKFLILTLLDRNISGEFYILLYLFKQHLLGLVKHFLNYYDFIQLQ